MLLIDKIKKHISVSIHHIVLLSLNGIILYALKYNCTFYVIFLDFHFIMHLIFSRHLFLFFMCIIVCNVITYL